MSFIYGLGRGLSTLNSCIPTFFSGLLTSISAWQVGNGYRQIKNLPDADPNVQKVFKEVVQECGLKPSDFSCKIFQFNHSPAQAFHPRVVAINQSIANNLVGSDQKASLRARSIIKHELGHLYYKDRLSALFINAVTLGTVYSLKEVLERNIFTFQSPLGTILSSIGALLVTCLQVKATWKIFLAKKRSEENRADQFAIEHTQKPEELSAVAEGFDQEFDLWLQLSSVIQSPGLCGGKTPHEKYEQTKKTDQSFKDWVIENRHKLGIGGESLSHPSPYDRANTFREGAAQLKLREVASVAQIQTSSQ